MTRFARVLAAALTFAPASALACGGFFCSREPVDQQAERIIFVQEDEQTITSYVEIMYQGSAEDFAWVVPVPAVPDLGVWNGAAFDALDTATEPFFQPPWECFAFDDADGGGAPGADPRAGGGEVEVLAREQVGPFDTATIESDDPRALVEWLRTNGFRIVEEMEPFIALYTRERMKFTAMKLQPGEGIDAIQPIIMTYRATHPAVPLRLTAVAALLEMGVKVWVLGDGRYGPMNVPDLEINDADIVFDRWGGQNNYRALVARAVDAAGRGLVTEFAQPTAPLLDRIRSGGVPRWADDDARAAFDGLLELLASKPYITRLYTRLSPEEMDHDPIFHRVEGGDVSNMHDLSEAGPDLCGDLPDPDPCAFAACGAAGECFIADDDSAAPGRAGCACADGSVARAVPDGSEPGAMSVACGDARMNFADADSVAPANGAPVLADPCLTDPCGANGRCVGLNGSATCACDRGFIAVATRVGDGDAARVLPTCVAPSTDIPEAVFAVAIKEPDLPYPGREESFVPDPGTMMPATLDPDPEARPFDPGRPSPSTDPTAGDHSGRDNDGCAAVDAPASLPLWIGALLLVPALRRRRR